MHAVSPDAHGFEEHGYESGELLIHAGVYDAREVGHEVNRLGVLDEVIVGAYNGKKGDQRDLVTARVVNGLVLADAVETKHVRFPRFHRLLGRMVVGHEVIRLPEELDY